MTSEANQYIPEFFNLIKHGNLEEVVNLIEAGMDVNSQFEEGRTPAIHAASNGHLDILKILVNTGADVNVYDQQLQTPLLVANYQGYQEIVDYLLPLTNSEIRDMVEAQLAEEE